jgi:dephospho-CoA kinase
VYVIGLTGGIGSGKSTVARILEEQGAHVLSADLIGHEVYLPGRPAYREIIEAFGKEVVADDGTIDRKKLGAIVFSDPRHLRKLNTITHPRMKGMIREKLAELKRSGVRVAVLEAALLFDAGWDDLADEVWVTVVPPEIAAKRSAARSGLSEQEVMERIKTQMSNEERVRRAQVVISTEGGLEDTRRRTLKEWEALRARLDGSP